MESLIFFPLLMWISLVLSPILYVNCILNSLEIDLAILNVQYMRIVRSGASLIEDDEMETKVNNLKQYAYGFLARYSNVQIDDERQRRQVEMFLQIDDLIFSNQTREKIIDLEKEAISQLNTPFDDFLDEVLKSPINSLQRDIELQKKWKSESEVLGFYYSKYLLDPYLKIIDEAVAESTRYRTAEALMTYVTRNFDFSMDQLKEIWNTQLKQPYRELMSFMRNEFDDMFTTYTGIDRGGPMPAYIFDLLSIVYTSKDENNRANELMYKRLMKPYTECSDPSRIQKYDNRLLALEAQKYFVSFGFDEMNETFWRQSTFSVNNSSTPRIYLYLGYDLQQSIHIHTPNITCFYFMLIHEQFFYAYQNMVLEQNNAPAVFWDPDNMAFSEGFRLAVLMAADSYNEFVELGFFTKKELTQSFLLEQFKGIAMSIFPQLASCMAMHTWKWDILGNRINPDERMCELWNRRYEYEWVVPVTYVAKKIDANRLLDVLSKNRILGNELGVHEFTIILFQYQIYAHLCERAGQYNPKNPMDPPLYKCNLRGNKEVGKVIRDVLSYGSLKTWRELLDIISGTTNTPVNGRGLLDYFAPLFSYIKKQNKKGKSPIKSGSKDKTVNFCRK